MVSSARALRTALLPALLVAALAGCGSVDTLRSGWENAQAVAAELEAGLGTKSVVGFNWHNGFLTQVTITFEALPAERSLDAITAAAQQAVAHHFEQKPKQLVIAFKVAAQPAPG